MKRRLLLLLCLLWPLVASAQAGLALTWREEYLQIDYSAGQNVCVWLVGGGLEDTRLGGECVPGGQIHLPYAGVDQKYTPLGRTAIELRGVNGLVGRQPLIPPSRIILPLIVVGERPVFTVRLVLVVN